MVVVVAGVVTVVVVSVVVVPGVVVVVDPPSSSPPPAGFVFAPAHEPSAAARASPFFIRFAAALTETETRTHGFDFDPVRWQSTTLPLAGSDGVEAAGAAVASPLPPLCGLPFPGGGFAIAIDAVTPATKSARNRILIFKVRLPIRGWNWVAVTR